VQSIPGEGVLPAPPVFRMPIDPRDIAICTSAGEAAPDDFGSMAPPIVQTSLFSLPTFRELLDALADEDDHYVYTRGQNPTVAHVERQLAALERGDRCKCFGSGMAAISAVLMGLLESGDHVLFINQIYGPTLQLANHLQRFGITHDVTYDRSIESIASAVKENTRLVWMESPSTMLFRMLDVPAVAALASERGLVSVMDNTWSTPLFQKPIEVGVDIVVHSLTKYVGGHSDVVAGAVITSARLMEQIFYRAFMLNGGILGPFDAWLLARGIRTLPIRLERHQSNALAVAEFLSQHASVRRVFHPALDPEDRDLAASQLAGYSGLLSFELATDEFAAVADFIDGLKMFRIGVSWGGFESLVVSPNRGDNGDSLAAQGIPPGLVRLSVGLEDADQLKKDLAQALS